MIAYAVLLSCVALLSISALYFFLGRLSRFPCRTIRDVPAFLQPVDSANVFQLLNPQTEDYLRSAMTGLALRLEQRRSLHFLREHLLRMSHNAHILLEWSNAELKREIIGQNEEYSVKNRMPQTSPSLDRLGGAKGIHDCVRKTIQNLILISESTA